MEIADRTGDVIALALRYVAVSGTAALVDRRSREVLRVVGDGKSTLVKEYAAALAEQPDAIRDFGPYLVGRVGADYAIVLRKGDIALDPATLADRMHRACATLTRGPYGESVQR